MRLLCDTNQIATVLAIVLARLYTVRNQLIHGGATWQGSVNRDQIRDGTAILNDFVPIISLHACLPITAGFAKKLPIDRVFLAVLRIAA